jgi:hypothetical protein
MGGACSTHGRGENCIQYFGSKDLKGRVHSEELDVDERINLEFILGKYGGRMWTGCIWPRIRISGAGCCEHDNKPSGSVKSREFFLLA